MIDEFDPPKNKKKMTFLAKSYYLAKKKEKKITTICNFEIPSNLDKTLCFKLLSRRFK